MTEAHPKINLDGLPGTLEELEGLIPAQQAFTQFAPTGRRDSPHERSALVPPEMRAQIDQQFRDGFAETVQGLDFQDVMVVPEGNVVREPRSFRLVPLIGETNGRKFECSTSSAGTAITLPDGVYGTYSTDNGKPFLDTAQALGLVNTNGQEGDWLIAIASVAVDRDGRLHITQIQDVTNVRSRVWQQFDAADGGTDGRMVSNWKAFSTNGLRNGFAWRDTFVAATEQIARAMRIPEVVVRSHHQSTWPAVRDHGKKGYDDVAERRGYAHPVYPEVNWVKRVIPTMEDIARMLADRNVTAAQIDPAGGDVRD